MYFKKLEEEREKVVDHIIDHHMRVKNFFDMRAKPCHFLKGDEVHLWDKRRESKGVHGKFDSLWKGSFVIMEGVGPNDFQLSYLDGTSPPFSYNG